MSILYIRHSRDDGICNREHDCDLTSEGRELARRVGKKIIAKYGLPSKVYVSPFHRTLQTVSAMLEDYKDRVKIIKDSRLSRYFSSREKQNPQVHSDTMQSRIPINDSFSEFKRRIQHFNNSMINSKHSGTVWCVTHSTVYKQLANLNEKTIPSYIPFMHYIRVKWCEDCEEYH